ncbi:hypothetical protein M1615_00830 [Patescibacteria group bacterium]|nr:hypothetical protein [Patescibacteria group bacterium]MCL5010364.1 hypothetical protein [Patescibacteria group bacterium]
MDNAIDTSAQQTQPVQPSFQPAPPNPTPAISRAEYAQNQQGKRGHLPLVLIILGLLDSIEPLIMAFTVVPGEVSLYKNLNTGGYSGYNPIMGYVPVGVIIVIALAQIIYGIVLMGKQKQAGVLMETQKKKAKILLAVGIVAAVIGIPVMIISVITPIYSLTNFIK